MFFAVPAMWGGCGCSQISLYRLLTRAAHLLCQFPAFKFTQGHIFNTVATFEHICELHYVCVCVSCLTPPDNRCGPWNRTAIWISFACLLRVRRFSNCFILRPYFMYSDTAFFGRDLTLTHYGSVLLKG